MLPLGRRWQPVGSAASFFSQRTLPWKSRSLTEWPRDSAMRTRPPGSTCASIGPARLVTSQAQLAVAAALPHPAGVELDAQRQTQETPVVGGAGQIDRVAVGVPPGQPGVAALAAAALARVENRHRRRLLAGQQAQRFLNLGGDLQRCIRQQVNEGDHGRLFPRGEQSLRRPPAHRRIPVLQQRPHRRALGRVALAAQHVRRRRADDRPRIRKRFWQGFVDRTLLRRDGPQRDEDLFFDCGIVGEGEIGEQNGRRPGRTALGQHVDGREGQGGSGTAVDLFQGQRRTAGDLGIRIAPREAQPRSRRARAGPVRAMLPHAAQIDRCRAGESTSRSAGDPRRRASAAERTPAAPPSPCRPRRPAAVFPPPRPRLRRSAGRSPPGRATKPEAGCGRNERT